MHPKNSQLFSIKPSSFKSAWFKSSWTIFAFLSSLLISLHSQAAYVFQTVNGEAFDSVSTDVVWTNDPAQTGYPIDDDYQLINIGFIFYLAETPYTQLRILANGALHFGADQGFHKDYSNEALPITGFINGPGFEEAADRAILGYWDDLEPSLGGTVKYGVLGSAPNRRLVVSWENVPRYNGAATSYSFQIVIFENGNIRFRYGNDQASGSSATIGIEVDNNDFTQYSFSSNSVNDATDILWIREFPAITSVVASCLDTSKVTVTFNSAISAVRANDPDNFSINNGISILNSSYISSQVVELTTSSLSIATTYTLTTTTPTQTSNFTLGTLTTASFSDQFDSVSYANNSGSNLWTGNWIEIADDGSPNSGNVTISGNELRFDDRPNSGGEPSIYRQLDLSGFTSATLTFDYNTPGNLENSDRFDILMSSDNGASYTVIDTFSNDVSGSASYDISAFISANTRLRFTVENNFGGNGERMEIDNVTITGAQLTPCTTSLDHFVINHDGSGINCLREAITITAVDSGGAVITSYAGLVNLSLSTAHGNWFTLDDAGVSGDLALGVLNDSAGDNDGMATYQFDPTDLGNVALYLQNTVTETTNIITEDTGIFDDNSEGDIIFRPFGFVFSPSPIATQIAGRPFNLTLTAAGQTPAQPECGVIEEYTGNKSINFWSNYILPVSSSILIKINGGNIAINEASSAPQNITFTTGVATLISQYDDVGQISISAKDEIDIGDPPAGNLDEIIGGVSPFVVRPFAFDIQISSDPYADDGNDAVFSAAGALFNMTLRSVLWQAVDDLDNDGVPDPFIDTDADGIPDTGGDLSDNLTTPNISQINGQVDLSPTALVVTNSNGNLSIISFSFANFIPANLANTATYTFAQSWDEVGILQVNALSNNFMGIGDNITGERINIGRFIPDHFLISAPIIVEQCGSFTYAGFSDGVNLGLDKNGQTFNVSGTITAENISNVTTQNYVSSFAKLTASNISLQSFNVSNGINATGTLNFSFTPLDFINGVSTYSDPNVDYQYDSYSAPFNLRVDINATDTDGVTSSTINSNDFELRLGRLRLIDSYGPEIADLNMRLFTDYFDGVWKINFADSCSTYIDSNVSFDISSYTDQLDDGETSIFAPTTTQTLFNGESILSNGLWFSAPGNNNFGSVLVIDDLSTQAWLTFDWDLDNILDNPSARLNFGYYRGSDRVIYWREVRN